MDQTTLYNLVTRAQQGDEAAMQELYLASVKHVYFLALKILGNADDAEDLAQDVFITVFQKLPTLQQPGAYFRWLNLITSRKCYNALQKLRPMPETDDELDSMAFENLGPLSLPEQGLDNEARQQILLEMIDALPDTQRVCVLYYYYEQLTIAQISEVTGLNQNTVKSRLSLARAKIRGKLEEQERVQGIKLYAFPLTLTPALYFALRSFIMPEAGAASIWGGVAQAGGVSPQLSGSVPDTPGVDMADRLYNDSGFMDSAGQSGSGQLSSQGGSSAANQGGGSPANTSYGTQNSYAAQNTASGTQYGASDGGSPADALYGTQNSYTPQNTAGGGQSAVWGTDASSYAGDSQGSNSPFGYRESASSGSSHFDNTGYTQFGQGAAQQPGAPSSGGQQGSYGPNAPSQNAGQQSSYGPNAPSQGGGSSGGGGGSSGGGGRGDSHSQGSGQGGGASGGGGRSAEPVESGFRKFMRNAGRALKFILPALGAIAAIIGVLIGMKQCDKPKDNTPGSNNSSVSSGNSDEPISDGDGLQMDTGLVYNSFSTHKGINMVPLEDGSELFSFNLGYYQFILKDDELIPYLSGSQYMPHGQTNFNSVRFGDEIFWLNGRVLMASPLSNPTQFRELDLQAYAMTYDDKNIYLISQKDSLVHKVNPATFEYTTTNFGFKVHSKMQDDIESGNAVNRGWAGLLVWEEEIYFSGAKGDSDEYFIWVFTPQTGEARRFLESQSEAIAGLCVDDTGFYYLGVDHMYHLPHGSQQPRIIYTYEANALDFKRADYYEARPEYLYIDEGWLYFTHLPYSGCGIYRMRPDGSSLMGINVPEERRNVVESKGGITVKNGWITYNYGALHLGEDGIDKEIYTNFPGYVCVVYGPPGGPSQSSSQGSTQGPTQGPAFTPIGDAVVEDDDPGGGQGGQDDTKDDNSSTSSSSTSSSVVGTITASDLLGRYVHDGGVDWEFTLKADGTMDTHHNDVDLSMNYKVDGKNISFTRQSEPLDGRYQQEIDIFELVGAVINDDGSINVGYSRFVKE